MISRGCTGPIWLLQRLIDTGKSGIFEIKYKEGTIKVEIKKKMEGIIVKRFRAL